MTSSTPTAVLGGVTSTVGGTLDGVGLTGDLGCADGTPRDAHVTADTHGATGGLLGITDGLL